MGLMDKRAADWTARDALTVWTWTGIFDLFSLLLVIPFLLTRMKKKPRRTREEILEAQRDSQRDAFP